MTSLLAPTSSPYSSRSTVPAAALTAAAAGIHLGVIPLHLQQTSGHAVSFILAAALQGLVALTLLRRPTRSVIISAVILNLGVAALWVGSLLPDVSSFLGLQQPHPLSTIGMLATSLELLAAALLISDLSLRSKATAKGGLIGLILVAMLGAGIAFLAPRTEHSEHSPSHAASQPWSAMEEQAHGVSHAVHGGESPVTIGAQLIKVEPHPEGVVLADGYVWVASRAQGTLSRIDPATGSNIGEPISVGDSPSAVLASDGHIWVASFGEGVVRQIDPQQGRVISSTSVGKRPVGLTALDGTIWVSNSAEGTVSRISTATGELIGTSERLGYGPTGIAAGGGSIWVVNTLDHAVVRLDPQTAQPMSSPIEVPRGALGATFSGGYLWIASPTSGQVVRIDPETNDIVGLPITVDEAPGLGLGPISLAGGQDTVWVVNNRTKSLIGLDVRTGLVTSPPRYFAKALGKFRGVSGIAVGSDAVWVTDYESDHLAKFQP